MRGWPWVMGDGLLAMGNRFADHALAFHCPPPHFLTMRTTFLFAALLAAGVLHSGL